MSQRHLFTLEQIWMFEQVRDFDSFTEINGENVAIFVSVNWKALKLKCRSS